MPSYKQDIFSVQSATENGDSVSFSPTSAVMTAPNGTDFGVNKYGKLYFLNSIKPMKLKTHSFSE